MAVTSARASSKAQLPAVPHEPVGVAGVVLAQLLVGGRQHRIETAARHTAGPSACRGPGAAAPASSRPSPARARRYSASDVNRCLTCIDGLAEGGWVDVDAVAAPGFVEHELPVDRATAWPPRSGRAAAPGSNSPSASAARASESRMTRPRHDGHHAVDDLRRAHGRAAHAASTTSDDDRALPPDASSCLVVTSPPCSDLAACSVTRVPFFCLLLLLLASDFCLPTGY